MNKKSRIKKKKKIKKVYQTPEIYDLEKLKGSGWIDFPNAWGNF